MLRSPSGILIFASALTLTVGTIEPAAAHHVSPATAQAPQTVPIELGTSGSSREHIVSKNRLFCYTGTLGSLVQDAVGGQTYILSNNHVLAKENERLNQGTGADGDIIHPGLLDAGTCTVSLGDNMESVATLSDYVEILFGQGRNKPQNSVDAAIAAVNAGDVDASGSILGIGPLSGNMVAAADAVGMPIQKTGRTTGHTFGRVLALEATVDVKYDSGTARFTDQLRIRHACDGQDFSDSGDSGSHIVTVPSSGDPDSVGLLFAGGDADTFANPMDEVASSLMVEPVAAPDGDTSGAMAADFDAIAAACGSDGGGGGSDGGPPPGRGGGRPSLNIDPLGLAIATEIKARNSGRIFALPDVVGHGVGFTATGEAVIEIYVASGARRAAGQPMPVDIEGIPVRVIETGVIRAF